MDSFEARDSPLCNARWGPPPPARVVGSGRAEKPDIAKAFAAEKARLLLEQEVAAERAREAEVDRQLEQGLGKAEAGG